MQKSKPTPAIPIDTDARDSTKSEARTAAMYTTEEMKDLYEVALDWEREGIDLRIVARFLVFRLLERTRQMTDAIEKAFAGQPFNRNFAADAPENQGRFKSYLENHYKISRFLLELINLTMIDRGLEDSSSRRKKEL